ncbi:hypothetical protein JANAI62_05330 [Jannaschia pagri]|uniref:Membrane-anchored protein n=1 Tax=Jannaschia pagri TaxID=2829797 RepID=A0ABQ4NHL6_9RHOB|nr:MULTISPECIES: DUF3422 domain-containing protein [unclassified Jannaschia]GIT89984.1 hypothetical protein JANAI61_04420 [Jannaschia sp. AI_61]GIT93910.1 hypothetical protein JANAI62_05330 [Jannaschia sp. AI_62]
MLRDHPRRYELANELHARPFPALTAPCRAAFLAVKREEDAVNRDRNEDRAHLEALLDRFGGDHPAPGATHFFGQLGKHRLKWESHTEFVTYTLFSEGVADRPFDGSVFDVFPADWLEKIPGVRLTSALIRVEAQTPPDLMARKLSDWFVPESLATSHVLDGSAVVASDFRIDPAGHVRFAVFAANDMGARRAGRIVQRLCEIETYKTMAMLALPRARSLSADVGRMDQELSDLVGRLREGETGTDETLEGLLTIGSELETMLARSAFRFGAQEAYERLVNQRIAVLREERFGGRQTFAEFMMRRFDPAMRTCRSVQARMEALAERAKRAGDLLSTRVNVDRANQNAALLKSMDGRAEAQLRLQKTVEGLSVVAISYYALGLVSALLYPLGAQAGMTKEMVSALVVLPVVALVWFVVRRIRQHVEK